MDIEVSLTPREALTIPLRQELPNTQGWKVVKLTRDRNAINVSSVGSKGGGGSLEEVGVPSSGIVHVPLSISLSSPLSQLSLE